MNSNNAKLVRNTNRYILLMTIFENNALTMEDLVRITNLSRPTILEILKSLIAEGLVTKSGKVSTAVGRQPATYCINNHQLYAMGIDIDFPEAHLAISNLSGEMIFSCSKIIPIETPSTEIVTKLVEMIEYALAETKIDRKEIIGLGLGTPALVDVQKNLAVIISKVPTWYDIDLAAYIKEKTGIAASIRNDAHVLGLIEKKYRSLADQSFIYVTHRSGVGSAIFIDGQLYDGTFGNSGYLGHCCVDINGPKCECGNYGCLELYCSKRAIVKNYNKKAIAEGLPACIDSDQVFALSKTGNQIARDVLADAGRILGIGISNLILSYDINHVILGWVKYKDEFFYGSLVASIRERCSAFLNNRDISIELGVSDEVNSGLAGCYLVLSQFLQAPVIQLDVNN